MAGAVAPSSFLPELVSGRGTVRRTVEGHALPRVFADGAHHAFDASEHFSRGYSQGENAVRCQPGVTSGISSGPASPLMRFAIDFDAKLRRIAVEIKRIYPCRMLTAAAMAGSVPSELLPKHDFGKRHLPSLRFGLSPRLSCALEYGFWPLPRFARPSTMLCMVPLPQQSWGRN